MAFLFLPDLRSPVHDQAPPFHLLIPCVPVSPTSTSRSPQKLRNDTAESLAAFENDMLQDFELQASKSRHCAAPARPPPLPSAHTSPSRARAPPSSAPVALTRPITAPQDQGLRVLAAVIIGYNFFFLFIGTFIFHGFMAAYGPLQALADNNIKPLHFSAFAAVSSFNNVGLSLLDDNYTSLYNRGAVLMLMCFMIVCGAQAADGPARLCPL